MTSQELLQADLVEYIDEVLAQTELEPGRLVVEVTEESLIESDHEAFEVMMALRSRGIELAIDDFGTGYASFAYLHRYPFDVLKIDRRFIQCIEETPKQLEIVKAIVALAHNLGLKVTAEGSETTDSLNCLRELSCEYAQGYSLGRPQLAQAMESELNDMFNNQGTEQADAGDRPWTLRI